MKKVILKSALLLPAIMLTSCASDDHVNTVSYWHLGDFLMLAALIAVGALVFLLFIKIQSIDNKLSQIIDLMQGKPIQNVGNQMSAMQSSSQPAPQPVQQPVYQTELQPAPQPVACFCPDCGTKFEPGTAECSKCGCPLA